MKKWKYIFNLYNLIMFLFILYLLFKYRFIIEDKKNYLNVDFFSIILRHINE